MNCRLDISHLLLLFFYIVFLLTDPTTSVSIIIVPSKTKITNTKPGPRAAGSSTRNIPHVLHLRHSSETHVTAPILPGVSGSSTVPPATKTPPIDRTDCIVGEWSRWIRSGYFQVRHRTRLQNPRNGGLKCPPLVTARKIRNKYRDARLSFDESSRRFLGSLIRGGTLQGDQPQPRSNAGSKRKTYLTKHYVWPERLLLTVLDDSLCVRKTSLSLKTKFMVLSLLESLCGTTYDKNAPTVGLQTYSVDSKIVMPLQRPKTKRNLRHSVLAYTTDPVKHLQLDRALERTVSILNETMNKKSFFKSAVLLVLSSWNYCDENTLGEAVLIKEHAEVYLLLIGPEPDTTQIQCFSSLASQPEEDHYIRLPETETINDFIAKILVAYYRNTFC